MSSRDHLFKVLVVGDAAVGKTSLVQRYSQDSFSKHYKSTVGGEPSRRGGWKRGPCHRLELWALVEWGAGEWCPWVLPRVKEVGVWDPGGNNCWVLDLHACLEFLQLGLPSPNLLPGKIGRRCEDEAWGRIEEKMSHCCVLRGNPELKGTLNSCSPASGQGQVSATSRSCWDPVEGLVRCQLGLLPCLSQEFQAAVDGAERCFTWLSFVWGMPRWESPLATQSDAYQG